MLFCALLVAARNRHGGYPDVIQRRVPSLLVLVVDFFPYLIAHYHRRLSGPLQAV